MKRITFALIVLIGVSFASCDFIGEKIPLFKRGDTLEAYQHRLDSMRHADSVKKAKQLEREKIRKAQARQDSLNRVREMEELARNKYHVIAGSFKTPKYAEMYFETMQKKGYTVKKVRYNNFDCISIYSTDTYSKAFNKIKEIKGDQEEVEYWVYKRQ